MVFGGRTGCPSKTRPPQRLNSYGILLCVDLSSGRVDKVAKSFERCFKGIIKKIKDSGLQQKQCRGLGIKVYVFFLAMVLPLVARPNLHQRDLAAVGYSRGAPLVGRMLLYSLSGVFGMFRSSFHDVSKKDCFDLSRLSPAEENITKTEKKQ